jgi:DNA (cytosine-5)-methyltransferase 1
MTTTNDDLIQVSYYKATEKQNKKRVWMQGLKLEAAGFTYETKYTTQYNIDTGTITLAVDPSGDRKVSGRKKGDNVEAIVEVFNAKTLEVLGDVERVRVDFYNGKLVITAHHHDTKQEEREARLKRNLSKGIIKTGSLCTGIGMAAMAEHQGFKEAGIQSSLEWIVDRESKYLQVAVDNNNAVCDGTKIFEASLEELEPELLTPVDHLQFSMGCTGHGKAGKAKNKNALAESHKTDATSLFGVVKIIEAVNPSVITSENVVEAKNSATYILLKSYLEVLGYDVQEVTLNNGQSGSFEARNRYWFVAVSKGIKGFDINTITQYEPQYNQLGDILEGGHTWSDNQYLKDKAITDKEAGKGFKRNLVNSESTSVNTIGRFYQKRRSCEPMLQNDEGKESLLSVNEVAKVKSCPLSLIKGVVASTAYQGLGQGIDFNQGRGIANAIGKFLKGVVVAKKTNVVQIKEVCEAAIPVSQPQLALSL